MPRPGDLACAARHLTHARSLGVLLCSATFAPCLLLRTPLSRGSFIIAESVHAFRPCAGGEVGGAARGGHLPWPRPRREKGRPLRSSTAPIDVDACNIADGCVGGVRWRACTLAATCRYHRMDRTRTRRQAGAASLESSFPARRPCPGHDNDLLSYGERPRGSLPWCLCVGDAAYMSSLGVPFFFRNRYSKAAARAPTTNRTANAQRQRRINAARLTVNEHGNAPTHHQCAPCATHDARATRED
jgi:hypothetical protein